ncbi:hypothetical protein Sme01_36020 [Sphaerisporangium melleum]|uniref:Uncharacterized protein n=1 Tax=Sphaerisporangium melleum TaxID=321316 RepID=A0A917RAL2_9ACTN|nr:hypothetical protein GCM10007964_44670 [Sphaerisporangium melleum]GII71126.1 hypothetical protein Sme01_36020 [Sphaerisporangium melleum]
MLTLTNLSGVRGNAIREGNRFRNDRRRSRVSPPGDIASDPNPHFARPGADDRVVPRRKNRRRVREHAEHRLLYDLPARTIPGSDAACADLQCREATPERATASL